MAWVGGRLTDRQTSVAKFYAFFRILRIFSLREKKEDTNRSAIKRDENNRDEINRDEINRDEINRDETNRDAPALMRPTIWVKKVLRM